MARLWNRDHQFLSYLAGFIDGEGTISVQRRSRPNGWLSFDPYLAIPNTNYEVLAFIHERIGFGLFRLKGGTTGHLGKKPVYSLWWSNRQAREVIHAVLPYLRVKRPQAVLVLGMPKRGGTRSPKDELERKQAQEDTYIKLKVLHGRRVA